jgi:serine-type D-Ala-D-Ala carboxypeptidase/endopeptidase (penicillin-binding protein 4)
MLELFSSGLMSVWLDMAGLHRSQLDASARLSLLDTPGFVLPTDPEPATAAVLQQYLKELSQKGPSGGQAVWMQSGPVLLGSKQGTVPLPAASLTKIATSLASLHTWGPSHQFETLFSATGPIENGVVQGDLVVRGSGDPLFVWPEAIAVGNSLNRMGIKRITGDLVIETNFAMNYQVNQAVAGQMLKQALNAKTWQRAAIYHHSMMAKGTPKPQVAIAGNVRVIPLHSRGIPNQTLLLRHRSLTLAQILKVMNIHSNNDMSQMLADLQGGAQIVAHKAAAAGGFPQTEIQLINGSGLGVENRISPRGAAAMLVAIQRYLRPHNLNVSDLFPVSGRDRNGTMSSRHMPTATVIKTGTLRDVSALAGVMPTRDRGLVWFTIINRGNDVLGLRVKQDQFLQQLLQKWGAASAPPTAIVPHPSTINVESHLGDAERNEIIFGR